MAKPGRPGASKKKKGPTVGSGGQGRQALEGRGPTPKAEDRSWHPAGKRKAANDRLAAARSRSGGSGSSGAGQQGRARSPKKNNDSEVVSGRDRAARRAPHRGGGGGWPRRRPAGPRARPYQHPRL